MKKFENIIVKEKSYANIPTSYGSFKMVLYGTNIDDIDHIAMIRGSFSENDEVLVRVHSECITGEVFGSCRCDCREQLQGSLKMIGEANKGVLIYLRGHEGRGIGLANKLDAYRLQDLGQDTVEANISLGFPADLREYKVSAQILRSLGIRKIKLITNNPKKVEALEQGGLKVVERISLNTLTNPLNQGYLQTKKDKLGHILDL